MPPCFRPHRPNTIQLRMKSINLIKVPLRYLALHEIIDFFKEYASNYIWLRNGEKNITYNKKIHMNMNM